MNNQSARAHSSSPLATGYRDFYTVAELADFFRLGERTIRKLIAEKKIGTVKFGSSVRIPGREAERLVVEGMRPAL